MKFSLLRPALAIGAALTLASCGGGGGKQTYPINVEVYNVQYPGLVLSTNGQDLTINGTSDLNTPIKATFPQEIEYGVEYDVLPKGQTETNLAGGSLPQHQSCSSGSSGFPRRNTAGLLQKIDVVVVCSVNAYPVGGTIKGLTGTGLVLINGSSGSSYVASPVIDATTKLPTDIKWALTQPGGLVAAPVTYNTTYGVTVLTQPSGQNCTVTGGNSPANNGSGTMDADAEKAGGVSNIVVTCTNK